MNKNKIIKALKNTLVILILLSIAILCLAKNIYALNMEEKEIKKLGDCGELLRYIEDTVKVNYMEWNGYPAYCIDGIDGKNEEGGYKLTIEDKPCTIGTWRILINGYPYKTLEELGVKNKYEAYTATKCALDTHLNKKSQSLYSAIGDPNPENGAGARTLKAMMQILKDANQSNEKRKTCKINIENTDSYQEGEYFVKKYHVNSEGEISNYKVSLSQEKIKGLKVVDLSGKEKDTFKIQDEFKVLIPLEEMKESGTFKITVTTELETNPILYGTGKNNYYIAGIVNEEISENIIESYMENTTNVTIISKNKNNGEPLTGSEFQLLNTNYEPVYTNLIVNEEGKIILKNMLPGTYYLKEIKSTEGYPSLPELIKIDLNFLKEITILISKEKSIVNEYEKQPLNSTENNLEESKSEKQDVEVMQEQVDITKESYKSNEESAKSSENIEYIIEGTNGKEVMTGTNKGSEVEKNKSEEKTEKNTVTVDTIKAEAPTVSNAAAGGPIIKPTQIKKLPVAGM